MSAGLSFGALPAFADLSPDQQAMVMQSLQARASEQQQPGSPDQLLFNRAGMGGGQNSFQPPQDGGPTQTGAVSREAHQNAPMIAMDEAAVRRMEQPMLPPTAGGNVPPVPQAAPPQMGGPVAPAMPAPTPSPAQPAPQAAPQMMPVNSFDPLSGQPTSGSPRPMQPPGAQPSAVSPTGAAQASGQAGGGGFLEKFANGLNNPAIGDLLLNVGIGLMSNRGFGPGLAAGLQGYQGSQANSVKQQLQQYQLLQQQQAQNATRAYLKGKGLSADQVEAATLNPAILSSVQSQMNKDPQQFTVGGNIFLGRPDQDPSTWRNLGPSSGPPSGYAPNPAGGVSYIPGGPEDPEVKKRNAEATATDRGFNLAPGQTRMDSEGKVIAAIPERKTIHSVEQPDGSKRDMLYDPETKSLSPIPVEGRTDGERGGNPFATGKFNDTQGKAAGFSDRMLGSEQTLRKLEDINKDAFGATIGAMVPNSMKSEDRQSYEQAKRSFINAQLRRESGAAIAPSEFDSAERQYFPQPGEGKPIIEQKRMERQRAIEAMAREGGPAYRPSHVFGEDGSLQPFGAKQNQGMASPKTQADFDALPKGAIYVDPQDGRKYRK
ncbi:hypothetical protein [Methylobacterium sp. WL7]|uniref:hypothetical protein n=1 Tax=Methylobacterium sp. WL7 TaxID=2603900 RepID=UPI0011C970FB|nr:hypothetical protein [Methylobacterium sp. WL7]TXN43586.1 hypothetical protein FV233_17975 [Methylobacterium sp. WL7]